MVVYKKHSISCNIYQRIDSIEAKPGYFARTIINKTEIGIK